MPKRRRATARDLLRSLEGDPEWVAARDRRERERAQFESVLRSDERELVAEIRAVGHAIDSVWDLVNNAPHPVLARSFTGPYDRAYPALVRHLAVPHHARTREGVVRALTVRDGGTLVESALLREFLRETDPDLRWVLANALRVAMPYRRRRKHPEIARALAGGSDADATG